MLRKCGDAIFAYRVRLELRQVAKFLVLAMSKFQSPISELARNVLACHRCPSLDSVPSERGVCRAPMARLFIDCR